MELVQKRDALRFNISLLAVALMAAGVAGPGSGFAAADPTADSGQTRYSLVNGCYRIDTPAGALVPAAGPYRMHATGLGEYLLYGRNREVLDASAGSIHPAKNPSVTAVWKVEGSGAGGFTLTNSATKTSTPATFVQETGCAEFPEAQSNANGTPSTASARTARSWAPSTRTRTSRPTSSWAATSTAAARGIPTA